MFKSVVWSSTIDYPNQVSTVLFVGTCNWNCEYCYNRNLKNNESIDFNKQILPRLINRKGFINHVVISGGECTCYNELENVINILRQNGFIVGIHTNGSKPFMINKIINEIDFIGMDIKTSSLNSYEKMTKINVSLPLICKSVELIVESKKEYEFRTTVFPLYVDINDCILIAKFLRKAKANKYILQQYDNSFDNSLIQSYSIEYLKEIQKKCTEIIPTFIKGW